MRSGSGHFRCTFASLKDRSLIKPWCLGMKWPEVRTRLVFENEHFNMRHSWFFKLAIEQKLQQKLHFWMCPWAERSTPRPGMQERWSRQQQGRGRWRSVCGLISALEEMGPKTEDILWFTIIVWPWNKGGNIFFSENWKFLGPCFHFELISSLWDLKGEGSATKTWDVGWNWGESRTGVLTLNEANNMLFSLGFSCTTYIQIMLGLMQLIKDTGWRYEYCRCVAAAVSSDIHRRRVEVGSGLL